MPLSITTMDRLSCRLSDKTMKRQSLEALLLTRTDSS